jgi:hypothetical protein
MSKGCGWGGGGEGVKQWSGGGGGLPDRAGKRAADRLVGEMPRILYAAVTGETHSETGGPARLPGDGDT